jgi:hypothetical protein
MKTPFILLAPFFLHTQLLFAQIVLTSNKTDKHVAVKGTQIFLSPPDGFTEATNFPGFQNPSLGASIVATQISGPYEAVKRGFTPEQMKEKGMTLLKRETIRLNKMDAELLTITQYAPAHGFDFLKFALILKAGPASTIMVNGNLPVSQKEELGEKLRKSVLSVYIDKSVPVDPFSSVDFTVDLSTTRFKHSDKTLTGSLILEGPGKEFMMIAKSIRPLNTTDKKGASIAVLKAMSNIKYIGLLHDKPIELDNAEGYLIEAAIEADNKSQKAIQAILPGENYCYVFVTFLRPESADLEKDFDAILRSFKRK